jgi:hypothetical protein
MAHSQRPAAERPTVNSLATRTTIYRISVADRIRGFVFGITEPFRKDRTAAWASLLALSLAVAPGISQRIERGTWGSYDPTISVLTATLIALIWTAHFTFRAVKHARNAEERDNFRRLSARQSTIAGVMAELDYLQLALEIMHERIAVKKVQFLERPQLRNALARIDLFSYAAAGDLSRFDGFLRQVESNVALYEADYEAALASAADSWIGKRTAPSLLEFNPERVQLIRTLIESAQKVIPLLGHQLMSDS